VIIVHLILLDLRKTIPSHRNTKVRDIISPLHFNAIVATVKTSVCVNVRHDLSFAADMVKTGNLQSAFTTESFQVVVVMRSRWNCELSGGARCELQSRQFNSQKLLPLNGDVMEMSAHLKERQVNAQSIISNKDTIMSSSPQHFECWQNRF